jgi:hypothetical protein
MVAEAVGMKEEKSRSSFILLPSSLVIVLALASGAARAQGSPGITWVPDTKPVAPAPTTVVQAPLRVPAAPPPPKVPGPYEQPPGPTEAETYISLEPPGPARLYGQLDSEKALFERWRQQGRQAQPREVVYFPPEPVLSRQQYRGRRWPALRELVEPNYLCHQRLLFEQPNLERSGWDLGFITPVVSAGKFFADTVTLPYHQFTDPCRCYECNTGYCLPGDPAPLLIQPPEWSVSGAVAEGIGFGTVLLLFP